MVGACPPPDERAINKPSAQNQTNNNNIKQLKENKKQKKTRKIWHKTIKMWYNNKRTKGKKQTARKGERQPGSQQPSKRGTRKPHRKATKGTPQPGARPQRAGTGKTAGASHRGGANPTPKPTNPTQPSSQTGRKKAEKPPPILSLFSLLSPRSLLWENRFTPTSDRRTQYSLKAQHPLALFAGSTIGKGCAIIFPCFGGHVITERLVNPPLVQGLEDLPITDYYDRAIATILRILLYNIFFNS